MNDKASFRMAIKERLSRMSENDRRVESQILVRELRKIVTEINPHSMGVYIPFTDEPNLKPLIQEWLDAGMAIAMPQAEMNGMHFRKISDLEGIGRDQANIPSAPNSERVDELLLNCILVPGRAFTKEGMRMGRGSGGYDHWIATQRKRNPSTVYIAVGFDCQLVQEMPVEPHDEKVDIVLTPSRMYKT